MTHDPQTIAWLDQEDARLAQTIRSHRWAVQYVGEGDAADEPAFGYTIGLYGLGHPELVICGLGHQDVHGILGRVAGMVADGRDLLVGELLTWSDRDGRIVVEALPNPGAVVLAANRFYERPVEYSVPAYQLTWDHADGTSRGTTATRAARSASHVRARGGRDGQSMPRSRISLATWPVALTLYDACSMRPSASTMKVDRMTPTTSLPYSFFGP